MKPGKVMKAKKGMSFSDKMKMVEEGKINKKTGKFTSMSAMREAKGFKPGESAKDFNKRQMLKKEALKAAKATRLGKIVLPIAAAGVAAQQYLKSKMKKKDKKMGGGMMQKYAEGGDAAQSPMAQQARRAGKRKKKPGLLGGAGRPAAKKKRVMPIISSSETHSRQKDGSMKMTEYRYSADDGKAQTHTVRGGKVVKYDNAPFKTIDSRTYGLRVGGSVTVKTKLGRNKPTKMY